MIYLAVIVQILSMYSSLCSGDPIDSFKRNNDEMIAITFQQPSTQSDNQNINIQDVNLASTQELPKFRSKFMPNCKKRQQISQDSECESKRNGGFCEEDEDYNVDIERRFNDLIKQSTYIQEVISNDILVDPPPVLRTRDAFISEITVCAARETIIYPKRAQTSNSDWVFILNQQHMTQGVRVEICLSSRDKCRVAGTGLLNTQCRQKFIYRKLLTMDVDGSQIVPETVLLPSCCVCYVSSDFILQSRMNVGNSTIATEHNESPPTKC